MPELPDVETFLKPFTRRRGTIKGRLLDQTVVAGLGNSTDPRNVVS